MGILAHFCQVELQSKAMSGTSSLSTGPKYIRIRQIRDTDVPEIVNLLGRGYPRHPPQIWEHVFACLSRRSVPADHPRFGYVIESDGKLVGVLILIFSTIWQNGVAKIRCNGLGLYVDPPFRVYAPLLTSRAVRDKNVTVLNITAAPHTRNMVQTSGFTRYNNGIFTAIPILSRSPRARAVRVIEAHCRPECGVA